MRAPKQKTISKISLNHLITFYFGLVPSAQGGVFLSPSKLGVDPSQQIFSSREHRPLLSPFLFCLLSSLRSPLWPPLSLSGWLPSSHVLGLSPSGHGGEDLRRTLRLCHPPSEMISPVSTKHGLGAVRAGGGGPVTALPASAPLWRAPVPAGARLVTIGTWPR